VSNKCVLLLDFTRPDVLNFAMLPSQPTPNTSNFQVRGNDATWVNGVFHEFNEYMRSHRSKMSWLHRHTVYDVLLWVLGFPFGLWCDAHATATIQKSSTSPFVQAALYIYVFLAALVGVRFLFHYARWIWPLVEYRQPKSRALAQDGVVRHRPRGRVHAALRRREKAVPAQDGSSAGHRTVMGPSCW
jgi:hypothetical protein